MNRDVWQKLLSLENRDISTKWFGEIHGSELNWRRAREITSAAIQSREYFRNAKVASDSVRSLLAFYGVASLSRAVCLLLSPKNGEESLGASHGLETVAWINTLSGDLTTSLRNLGKLEVRTTSGLFSDFVRLTRNRNCIHINSSAVGSRILYDAPKVGDVVAFHDILSRIPDLEADYSCFKSNRHYAYVNQLCFKETSGLRLLVHADQFSEFSTRYEQDGYEQASREGDSIWVSCSPDTYITSPPLLLNSYVNKHFGAIPSLHIVDPLPHGVKYSQLAMMYMVAYFLGMLVRYFPTHWTSLTQRVSGDEIWPTLVRAQDMVEESFPELVIELIEDVRRCREGAAGA